MDAAEQIRTLLNEYGAVLKRQKKHQVWEFPDGRTWVVPSTPSDHRTTLNNLATLRTFLGAKRLIHKNPERESKHGILGRPQYQATVPATASKVFREELEKALRVQREQLADLVANCEHPDRPIGGFTYWCPRCRKQWCARCWSAHLKIRHGG